MTSLPIQFKHDSVDHTRQLERVVEQKFQSLEKYIGKETDVRAEVEFEKAAPRQSGKLYRVEANIRIAGTLYRAEATEDTYEKAIDVVRSELDAEMRRAHSKRESMIKRGGRKLKEMMRWGKV
jgi:ribosomal subunit interface protein